jgi:hypothetical protein
VSVVFPGVDEFVFAAGNDAGDLSRRFDHVDRFHTGIECLAIDFALMSPK